MIRFTEWWKYPKKEIMSQFYWLRGQLPPSDKIKYEESWEQLKTNLEEDYPSG